MKKYALIAIIFLSFTQTKAQKIGVVLSGGGAKGLAHIGVLKALEENNIPIDYIVGTSMGGIVAGMYAAGYTPAEIEKIALSKDLQEWTSGNFQSDYAYYFRKKPDNPSLLSLKLQLDTGFHARVRSSLINDTPLNFGFLELFSQASANAKNNFDSLFVPFRCVVADVVTRTSIPISRGNLADAIRGTCAVPFFFRPVKVNNKYVFDGGIYNNFPIDVLKKDFNPDYIIGSNVSSKIFNEYPKDDERLMSQFLLYMFLANTDSTTVGKNGVYLQPIMVGHSPTNFSNIASLIQRGYEATLASIPQIKENINRQTDSVTLNHRRSEFRNKSPKLIINDVVAVGVNSEQTRYIEDSFKRKNKKIDIKNIKESYYRLISDDSFETVYPKLKYYPDKGFYNFELQVQPHRYFKVDVGGVVSSRPINNAYLGLQYNFLGRNAYTFATSFYSGRFYESVQGTARVDVPGGFPFYLETEYTYNNWDYFNDSKLFIENVKPTFIKQFDKKIALKMGIPFLSNGKIEAQFGLAQLEAQYSPTDDYKFGNRLDLSTYGGLIGGLKIESNTLNSPQYPTKGLHLRLSFNHYSGGEQYFHGDVLKDNPSYSEIKDKIVNYEWSKLEFTTEHYIVASKTYSLGYLLEGVLSNKPLFSTYKSTLISSPAFYPLQDSKTIFLDKFRADSYGAFGLKNVFNLYKNLDLRLEAYMFQPVQAYLLQGLQSTTYAEPWINKYYAATAALVYHSIVGPISLSFNHYNEMQKNYDAMMFHVGFLIYNKRSLD